MQGKSEKGGVNKDNAAQTQIQIWFFLQLTLYLSRVILLHKVFESYVSKFR